MGVGVDVLSIDPGPDNTYQTHRVILGAGKWALEALANVAHLPAVGAVLFVGAPKVRDATGGPARVMALAPPVPNFDPPALEGVWESERPERTDMHDGTSAYLTRRLALQGDTWQVRFTLTSDAEGRQQRLSGDFGGTFEVGEYSALLDAFEVRFQLSRRTMTPGNDQIAAALGAAGCGTGPWRTGVTQNVHESGCDAFRVIPAAMCGDEYDLVQLRGQRLFLGARPADGNLCSESRRPVALSAFALIHRR